MQKLLQESFSNTRVQKQERQGREAGSVQPFGFPCCHHKHSFLLQGLLIPFAASAHAYSVQLFFVFLVHQFSACSEQCLICLEAAQTQGGLFLVFSLGLSLLPFQQKLPMVAEFILFFFGCGVVLFRCFFLPSISCHPTASLCSLLHSVLSRAFKSSCYSSFSFQLICLGSQIVAVVLQKILISAELFVFSVILFLFGTLHRCDRAEMFQLIEK